MNKYEYDPCDDRYPRCPGCHEIGNDSEGVEGELSVRGHAKCGEPNCSVMWFQWAFYPVTKTMETWVYEEKKEKS